MNNREPIRQGDVLLIPCETIPSRAVVQKREEMFGKGEGIIIAAGEATGHHHRVRESTARLRTDPQGVRYLRTGKNGATLTHEEHDPIELPPLSSFRVGTQREYEPPKPEVKKAPARPAFRRVYD